MLTVKKLSKYRVFTGPNAGEYGPEKTPKLDTFHAVALKDLLNIYSRR